MALRRANPFVNVHSSEPELVTPDIHSPKFSHLEKAPIQKTKTPASGAAKNSIWIDFVFATSFHGFHEAYSAPNKFWKVFWILMLFVGMGSTCYEIYKIIDQHVKHPISTSVSRQYKPALDVPDITVCFPQRINWTWANQTMGVSEELLEYMNGVFLANYPSNYLSIEQKTLNNLEVQYQALIAKHKFENIEKFYEQGTLSCNQMFKDCIFGGLALEGHCCNHIRNVTTTHGSCFKVSAKRNNTAVEQHFGGPSGGFILVIQMQPDSQPKTFYNTYHDDGIYLFIGNKQDLGDPIPYDANSVMIPSGTHAYVSLEAKRYLNIFGFGCHQQSQLTFFRGYGKQACLYECTLNATLERCGCVSPGYNVSNNMPVGVDLCGPYQAHTCVNPHMYGYEPTPEAGIEVNTAKYYNDMEKCDDNCGYLCDYMEYEPKVMYTKYPPDGMQAKFKHHYNLDPKEDFENQFIMVEVFFAHIAEMVTKQVETASINGLIGNIGGQLGLFMGASLMTLIHSVVYWFGYNCCGRQKKSEVEGFIER